MKGRPGISAAVVSEVPIILLSGVNEWKAYRLLSGQNPRRDIVRCAELKTGGLSKGLTGVLTIRFEGPA